MHGNVGINDYHFDEIILDGYAIGDRYRGFYKNGMYHGCGSLNSLKKIKLADGRWEYDVLIDGIEYDWLIKVVSGDLIYKPDCLDDPYDATDDFYYEKIERYGDEIIPFLSSTTEIKESGIEKFYVVDMKVMDRMEQMVNIRTLKDFLLEKNPNLLERIIISSR